jgi:hypothetical protein
MATIDRFRPPALASNPHARLGLRPGATATDIKRAYRTLVMRFHPDRAGDTSLVDFLAIQAAYESLHADPPPAMPDAPDAPPTVARTPERRGRGTGWAGARWYWEGLLANAARAARRE